MLFLATFFPMSDMEEEEGEHQFDFLNDFLRATVDIADLVGIYLVMSRVAGKGSVKVLVAGLGWGFAELVLTRLVFLWVGARGVEFDWKYIQKSFDANISLLHFISWSGLDVEQEERHPWTWRDRRAVPGAGPRLLQGPPGLSRRLSAAAGQLGQARPGRGDHPLPVPSQPPALPGRHQFGQILDADTRMI